MTALAQLHSLWRLFPRAIELAVSRDLAYLYEMELIQSIRYCVYDCSPHVFTVERFGTFTAERSPLSYRGKPLTIVEPIHA